MVQNKLLKTKKTEVVKRNENPEFNESFTFKLPLTSLDTANVTITAMQHQSGYKGKYIILSNASHGLFFETGYTFKGDSYQL